MGYIDYVKCNFIQEKQTYEWFFDAAVMTQIILNRMNSYADMITSEEDLQKKQAVQSAEQTSQKITKEKEREEPCVKKSNLPKLAPISSDVKVTEPPADSVTGSKKPKLEDKSVRSNKEQTASKQVRAGTVHIPKCLTVTVVTPEERTSMESSDVHCAQPCEEDSVLRSENARTPVGEGVSSCQSSQCQQSEDVGFTSANQIQPGEPEMAEEAPQLESEQGSTDVPADEEPEFDYYGCEVCKSEAKAYDRLSFTHKCPICPCMCFCSHLLKEHMRVIHGWFNVQRKFTQNY